jgi:hypothetical protein
VAAAIFSNEIRTPCRPALDLSDVGDRDALGVAVDRDDEQEAVHDTPPAARVKP